MLGNDLIVDELIRIQDLLSFVIFWREDWESIENCKFHGDFFSEAIKGGGVGFKQVSK